MSELAGVFLLGVLSGWIVEWIFVRFFMPNTKKKLQSQLDSSRKDNETLQQQTQELKSSLTSTQAENSKLAQELKDAQAEIEATKNVVTETVTESEEPKTEPVVEDEPTISEEESMAQDESATTTEEPVEETVKDEPATSAEEPVVEEEAKPVVENEVATSEAEENKSAETKEIAGDDDLTRINGVGPKLAKAMQAVGISTYAQVAAMTEDSLNEKLESTGIRYVKANVNSWPQQAKFAMQADWNGLKTYQESLKK